MIKKYLVVFDDIVKTKLQKIIDGSELKVIITSWLDRLENNGPVAGKLLDNHIWLYEMKNKHPPLRLYFYYQKSTNKIIIFELEMKTSLQKQQKTISRMRYKITKFLNLFVSILFFLDFPNIQEVVDIV